MTRPVSRARAAGAVGAIAALLVTFTGCDAWNSITGSPDMQWTSPDPLPKDEVEVEEYRTTALLPHLTPKKAAAAFGHSGVPKRGTETLSGDGWSVTVKQSEYATFVKYDGTCGKASADTEALTLAGQQALSALGGSPEEWTWFSLTTDDGVARVIAEPNIDNVQTWGTGSLSIKADDDGLCALNGVLMGFEKTGQTSTLDSAYETFQKVRHTDGLPIDGEYVSYEQTWTLLSEGVLVPVWWYGTTEHGIVAVDLGDGLETALDTESVLSSGVSDEPPAAKRARSP